MDRIWRARLLALGTSLTVFAGSANADAGVPMLFVTFPAMVLALIPIILLESIVLSRVLQRKAVSLATSAATANVASTIVGVPLTWVALVFLQWATGGDTYHQLAKPLGMFLAVTWQAPWLLPYRDQLYWMVPVASLVLLVPFFFASYFIEAPIVARFQRQLPKAQVRRAVFQANVASYAGLLVVNLVWIAWALAHAPIR